MTKKKHQHQAEQWLKQGTTLYEEKAYLEALPILKKAAEAFQQSGDEVPYWAAMTQVGECYIELFKWDEAIDCIQTTMDGLSRLHPNTHIDSIKLTITMGKCWASKDNLPKALSYFQEALAQQAWLVANGHEPTLIQAYLYLANLSIDMSNYPEALQYCQAALKMLLDRGDTQTDDTAMCYTKMAEIFKRQRKSGEAIIYKQKALNIFLHLYGEDAFEVAYTYTGLGTALYGNGEYKKAMSYFDKTLAIYLKILGKEHSHTCFTYVNLSSCLQKLGRFQEALVYLLTALKTELTLVGEHHSNLYWYYQNIGMTYSSLKKIDKAIEFLQKALQLSLKLYGSLHALTAESYFYIGKCYQQHSQPKQAIPYFRQSYSSNIPQLSQTHFLEHIPIDHWLNNYILLEALRLEAKAYFEQYQTQHADIQQLHYALNNCHIAIALTHQVRSHSNNEGSKLLWAKNTFRPCALGIAIASKAAKIAKEQPLLFKKASDELAQINATLYPPEKLKYAKNEQDCIAAAFEFCEQSKSMVLFAHFKEDAAKELANIPKDLLEQEQHLRKERTELLKKINIEQLKPADQKDEAQIRTWHDAYFDCEQAYQALIKNLETTYPDYYDFKYNIQIVQVSTIQQQLLPNQALINYFVIENAVYSVVLTKGKVHLTSTPISDFKKVIDNFRAALLMADHAELSSLSRQLYDLLVAPVRNYLNNATTKTTQLIIIPQDDLYYIPFELLQHTQNGADRLLIEDYNINYHYSATLWLHGLQRQQKTAQQADSFFGLAPVVFNKKAIAPVGYMVKSPSHKDRQRSFFLKNSNLKDDALQDLTQTEAEVQTIYQLFENQGKSAIALFYDQANKQNLQQHIADYKYVLISTHGFVKETEDGAISGIYLSEGSGVRGQESGVRSQESEENRSQKSEARGQKTGEKPTNNSPTTSSQKVVSTENNNLAIEQFNNNILYTSETYNLQLSADLVILSSCESGVGKLAIGEGIMGLNRGFLYAGASNIIYSLFQIPETATKELTYQLFQHILAGDSYTQALRKAKLKLMQQIGIEARDWAGMVLIGG